MHDSQSKLPLLCLLICLFSAIVAPAMAQAAQDAAFADDLEEAQKLYRGRDYEEALRAFRKLDKRAGGKSLEVAWGLAQSYQALGANKNAIEVCERVLALAGEDKPMRGMAYNMKGLALVAMADDNKDKKLIEAEAAFRSAIENHPAVAIIYYNLGYVLLKQGKDAEGADALRQYLARVKGGLTAAEAKKMIENPRRARENFAPDFSFTSLQGEYISLEDLQGKVVVLDFWGTWCPPCVASVPSLVRMAKKFEKDPVLFISISTDTDEPKWKRFVAENKMTWPQFRDDEHEVVRAYQVRSYPTYLVVDHEGVVKYRNSGYGPFVDGEIEGAVKKSLKTLASAPKAPRASTAAAAPPASTSATPAPASNKPAPQPGPPAAASAAPPAGGAPRASTTDAKATQSAAAGFPVPDLEFRSTENVEMNGMQVTLFLLRIRNAADFSDEYFQKLEHAPPCALNVPATRLSLTIVTEQGLQLSQICSLPERAALEKFAIPVNSALVQGGGLRMRVQVVLSDRQAQRAVKSNLVSLSKDEP